MPNYYDGSVVLTWAIQKLYWKPEIILLILFFVPQISDYIFFNGRRNFLKFWFTSYHVFCRLLELPTTCALSSLQIFRTATNLIYGHLVRKQEALESIFMFHCSTFVIFKHLPLEKFSHFHIEDLSLRNFCLSFQVVVCLRSLHINQHLGPW